MIDLTFSQSKDTLLISRLNRTVHELHVPFMPDFFKPWDEKEMAKRLEIMLKEEGFDAWIAWNGENAVAYALIKLQTTPETAFNFERKSMLIDQMAVLPDWQGKGLGRALMNEMENLARKNGVKHLTLTSHYQNEGAIRFYQNLGFQENMIRFGKEIVG